MYVAVVVIDACDDDYERRIRGEVHSFDQERTFPIRKFMLFLLLLFKTETFPI